jgi:hypothetical protein
MHHRLVVIVVALFFMPSFAHTGSMMLDDSPEAKPTHSDDLVPQFGTGFDETIIASSSDGLNEPRDLEFHPGATRSDELWIVNRADDSMVIVHETGTSSQTSEKRLDAYRNHFMEEVSAIAFGSYNSEFDYQFGTAQESRNTYNGQGSPNNFMGPALWPSSLSHFAREHQSDGLLGSHTDMLHESPNGMGIAHDSGNAYWYFDGYYGNLVYYDFQQDHDTGEDDHSDGIVRRHTDISLSRYAGVPGHMIMDQSNGILYIADTGNNRVLWVNTDDTSVSTSSMMNHGSRLEPLQEYSAVTGREFGVLSTGLSRPSGIALDGDRLFVSANGNNSIWAFDLATNGKSASLNTIVQTQALSIMGLEIGPNGALYYVDGSLDRVVRLDPYADADGDHVRDSQDNCPDVVNADQSDYDGDLVGDVCDNDGDGDGVLEADDDCEFGVGDWTSTPFTDYDGDGCYDLGEDADDDNDGRSDDDDDCPKGVTNTPSTPQSDFDGDGCLDASEDEDDDNDDVLDADDACPTSPLTFQSNSLSDLDGDGCEDATEDTDDDNDGYADEIDICPTVAGTASEGMYLGCVDSDGDHWADVEDVYPENPTQWADTDEDGFGDELNGDDGDACPGLQGTSTIDRFGCPDTDGDGYSNPSEDFGVENGADAFPLDLTQWSDADGDGYGDNEEGLMPDACPLVFGTSSVGGQLGCVDGDGDGVSDSMDAFPEDSSQWVDSDGDGYGDASMGAQPDACPQEVGTSTIDRLGCLDTDGDGWSDEGDAYGTDAQRWSDADGDGFPDQQNLSDTDDCPEVAGTSSKDRIGCLDSDDDGVSDQNDAYPEDAARSELTFIDGISLTTWLAVVLLLGAGSTFAFVVLRKKESITTQSLREHQPPMDLVSFPQPIAAPPLPMQPTMPPLPPEGLPAGWSMEQWQHYGEEYLKRVQ